MKDERPKFNGERSSPDTREFSSPPCSMHELDADSFGLGAEPSCGEEVANWRKVQRKRLIAERLSVSSATRRTFAEQIAVGLEDHIKDFTGHTCSFYWPFRGEPDLLPLMRRVHQRGGTCALPCVVERNKPLVFRVWEPEIKMERGVWNIPVPADSSEVTPDIVIAPVVGFDQARYRLGYGGGFFDRTLAALQIKPRVFGVGYAQAEVATIYPQDSDIPMDGLVTERGSF